MIERLRRMLGRPKDPAEVEIPDVPRAPDRSVEIAKMKTASDRAIERTNRALAEVVRVEKIAGRR